MFVKLRILPSEVSWVSFCTSNSDFVSFEGVGLRVLRFVISVPGYVHILRPWYSATPNPNEASARNLQSHDSQLGSDRSLGRFRG